MTNRQITFEVCIDSVDGAVAAQAGGGDRLELCDALDVGGLTPSRKLIQGVLAATNLPVMIMIRPRAGSFIYTPEEAEQMQTDISMAKELGVAGVVFGCLDENRMIETSLGARLLEQARPLSVTFHRAFDNVADPLESLSQLEDLGVDRVLTSGLAPSAAEGTELLRQMVAQSKNVIIMPGAGLRPDNARDIRLRTGATEFHGTASEPDSSQPSGRTTSEDTVRAIRRQLELQ